jgi:orotate phosphoribosyltransferase
MSSPPTDALVEHLLSHAVRTDGPFTLRSGEVSPWYIDARQTTFDGRGARLVADAVLPHIPQGVTAVGGLTMGADPIAVATAVRSEGRLKAFSIRKQAKDHGAGGRLVGPVGPEDVVVVLEDTTTSGGAIVEAIGVLRDQGVTVAGVLALVDRSDGAVPRRMEELGVAYAAVVTPAELGLA